MTWIVGQPDRARDVILVLSVHETEDHAMAVAEAGTDSHYQRVPMRAIGLVEPGDVARLVSDSDCVQCALGAH